MEDDGVGHLCAQAIGVLISNRPQILSHIKQMLNRKNKSFQDLVKTLQIYHDNVDEPEPTNESTLSQKDILQNLIAFLSGS